MVKIFIGNVASDTSPAELRGLFEKYGEVTECDVVKNFGFVHMSDLAQAEEAIRNLHREKLNGWPMNVELSKGRPKSSTKLHVGNLGEGVTADVLRAKFQEFGSVVECDVVKDYAFVHMERMEDAMDAINKMDNTAFKGKLMSVRLSTSRLRTTPGMGDHTGCFVCGKHGHWSKDCPVDRNNSHGDDARGFGGRGRPRGPPAFGRGGYGTAANFTPGAPFNRPSFGMPPPPRRPGGPEAGDRYGERSPLYERDRGVDHYEKYRARPYGGSYFEERRTSYIPPPPPPPPPPSEFSDPYERRLPPAPAPAPPSAYYAKERDPIRRVPVAPAGYGFERKRLSPPAAAGRGAYAPPRPKEYFAPRFAPY
ncbi:RNA-binding protein 4.1-like [Corythoichthys intestinalis]|uniref:RNA-binding protein 4.1-like n=1 Tax=Corythoichthys intestinalis TaxID=161448 RepID=UPI0025A5BE21|nr:RNA-binding protein 4.1-like [Corythoichthys intestinalis]XP_061810967.1 RNA-binding protein 4.1-like [Nerophis lumbriciformis]